MNTDTNYQSLVDYKRFESIMNTKEYLSQEEYDFCFGWDKSIRIDTSYIGEDSSYGAYLNLRLYSEHDSYDGDDCNNN